jgi:hypothetical protein
MKKRIANESILLLVIIVFLGLFQAWKQNRNPFVNSLNQREKRVSYESHELKITDIKSDKIYTSKLIDK